MADRVEAAVLDVSKLPTVVFGIRSITWWGIIGMMAIEGMVFLLMIASYFYLHSRGLEWPPHSNPPALFWGTLNLTIFVLSAIPNEWYRRRARKGDLRAVRIGLVALTLVGIANVVVRYFELRHLNTRLEHRRLWLCRVDPHGLPHLASVDRPCRYGRARRALLHTHGRRQAIHGRVGECGLLVFRHCLVDSDLPGDLLGAEVAPCLRRRRHVPLLLSRGRICCCGLLSCSAHRRRLINTIVGYTVAHWACDMNYKRMSFVVSAIDFVLCLCAFALSFSLFHNTPPADESQPEAGRRSFMAKSGMLLSVMSVLVVIAGTAALLILNPCD